MNRVTLHRSASLLVFLLVASCASDEKYDAKAPDVPFVSQIQPAGASGSYDGSMNCGPAVLAGIAKGHGLAGVLSDADLIEELVGVAGTTSMGTTGNGMIAALDWMGMETSASQGADLDWIDNELASGH